jgi:hypothetical protein
MSLYVTYLEDGVRGIDNKDVLIKQLRANASNGGDTRCLCGGCLAYWALKLLVDEADVKK